MNESSSPKGAWDGLKGGEVAGEGSGPLPHVCTAPGSWAWEEGSSPRDSLSVTIGVRHLAGTRKSGITQETEIVAPRPGATFGGSALNLVHKPNFWCNIPQLATQ